MSRIGKKLTPDLLKKHILEVIYEDRVIGEHRVIHCHLKMDNGFVVYGKEGATSIDPKNFDVDLGKKIAYEKTFKQLWELEAYRALIEDPIIISALDGKDIDVSEYVTHRNTCHNPHMMCNESIEHYQFVPGFAGAYQAVYLCDQMYDERNRKTLQEVIDFARSVLPSEVKEETLVLNIARLCHQANRAYCQSIGDNSQPEWHDAPEWQKASAVSGVKFHLSGDRKPSDSHENWLVDKEAEGWVYGPVKDPVKKTHPCFVPYEQLPAEQKSKDFIFKSIVDTFK